MTKEEALEMVKPIGEKYHLNFYSLISTVAKKNINKSYNQGVCDGVDNAVPSAFLAGALAMFDMLKKEGYVRDSL